MDPQLLLEIIWQNIRNNDNQLRQAAETQLLTLYSQSPDELINCFLDILGIPSDIPTSSSHSSTELKQVKNFVTVQLNNSISRHPRPPYSNIWPKINSETQKRIKQSFFMFLKNEEDLSLMKRLAGSLGRLAANLIINNEEPWPEFKILLLDIFLSCSEKGVRYGFYILQSFYQEEINNFKNIIPELYHLLETGLEFVSNYSIQIGALKCFKAYLKVLDHSDHPIYQKLIPIILKAVNDLIENSHTNTGLYILSEMLELQPRFFKSGFQQMCSFFIQLYKSNLISTLEREVIVEIITDYCGKYPSLFKKNSDYIPVVFDLIILLMLEKSNMDISQQWMVPEQGFEENNTYECSSLTRYGMNLIDNFIRDLGQDLTLTPIITITEYLLNFNKSQYQYNGIMILGILGEHMELENIERYLPLIVNTIYHEHPMMRYASIHAIGLLANDLRPKFQNQYGVQLLRRLKERLQCQTIPRIIAHIQGALCNLLDNASFDLILPYFEDLTKTIMENAHTGISIVKDTSMNLLTCLVEISKYRFEPYLEDLLLLVSTYFNSECYKKSCYNGLRSSALETMSFVCIELPRDSFQPYLNSFLELLMRIPNLPSQEQPSFQKVIITWTKLSIIYSEELEYTIDKFLPQIFQTLDSYISDGVTENYPQLKEECGQEGSQNEEDSENSQEGEGDESSYRSKLISEGIMMFKTFGSYLPSLTTRYFHQTIELFSHLIRNYPDQTVKENACNAIPKIIKCILKEQQRARAAKKIISDLLLSFEQARSSYSSDKKIEAIHLITEDLNDKFFTIDELHILTDKLMYHLSESEKQKQQFYLEVSELDEDQCQNAKVSFEMEENIQFRIVETFGDIFKIYGEVSYYLARQLLDSILIEVFLNSKSNKSILAGIFLIDDMIEHLGYSLLSQQWPFFEEILRNHLNEEFNCPIRQAAAYGLGILAQKTPLELRNAQTAENWLQVLTCLLQVQKQKKQKIMSFLYARDNIVASIGKILKAHLNLINLEPFLSTWLLYLPLKKDRNQFQEQYDFFIQLILDKPQIILSGHLMQRIIRVMGILGEILKNKLVPQNKRNSAFKVIEKIVSTEFFRDNMDSIMEHIQDSHREVIWTFVNSFTPS